jgi:hypothetical protein
MMPLAVVPLQPVGYRGFVAHAAPDARPAPLYIEVNTFTSKAEARTWVEEARRCCADPANFAASVVPVYPYQPANNASGE